MAPVMMPDPPSYTHHVATAKQGNLYWARSKVRRLLPSRPHALSSAEKKRLRRTAHLLGVTPEMVRCGACKLTDRDSRKERGNDGGGKEMPIISQADYLKFKMGTWKTYWKEEFAVRALRRVKEGKVGAEEKAKEVGIDVNTLKKRVAAVPKLEVKIEPEADSATESEMGAYDIVRMKNIAEKKELFKQLGLNDAKSAAKKRTFRRQQQLQQETKWKPKNLPPERRVQPFRTTRDEASYAKIRIPPAVLAVPTVDTMPLDDLFPLAADFTYSRHCVNWYMVETSKNGMAAPLPDSDLPSLAAFEGLEVKHSSQVASSRITACSIYPDKKAARMNLVAVGDEEGVVTLWNPRASVAFKSHSRAICSLEFNASWPTQLISASPDGFVRCHDLESQSLQLVFDAKEHFRGTGGGSGDDGAFSFRSENISWVKLQSQSHLLIGNARGEILLYDTRCAFNSNAAGSIYDQGNGRPAAISTGNSNHICVPGRLSIAFLDLRMTENDGASEAVRFRALGQEPVSVEYADWSEEVLVSLSPLGNQRGKAVVIDLLDDSVNATFDGAITEEGAAIWHPGDLPDMVFFPVASFERNQVVLGCASVDDPTNVCVLTDSTSKGSFGIKGAVNSPFMALFNGAGKGSLSIVGNKNFNLL